MRTKSIWIVALLFLHITPMMLHAQSYDKLWKEVDKAKEKGLPQTAIKYVDEIFREAQKNKNAGQMLKAYAARSVNRQYISPDSFYVDLKGLEEWATTAEKPEDRAVLHALAARWYSDYASSNYWQLQQRTDVTDDPAEDIREWSKNMFVQKVVEHTNAALENPKLLLGLSSSTYIPFVIQGDWSRYYDHNMYQLLATYSIGSLQGIQRLSQDKTVEQHIQRIFNSMGKLYSEQQNKDAMLLLALDEMDWRMGVSNVPREEQLDKLNAIISTFSDRELCVEAYWRKAKLLSDNNKKTEALSLCEEIAAKYPKYARINILNELKAEILQPVLNVRAEGTVYPGDTVTLNVLHANLQGFTVHYYKVNLPATSPLLNRAINDAFYKNHTTKVSSHHFALVPSAEYLQQDTVLTLPAPKEGVYVMQIVSDVKALKSYGQLLYAAPLKLLSRKLSDNNFEAVVLDAKSGKPVPGANVHLYSNERGNIKHAATFTTATDGRVELPWNEKYMHITAEQHNNFLLPYQRIRGAYYRFEENNKERLMVTLLTDRSLYRPGQTVYVKGIAYNQIKDIAGVVSGKGFTLMLTDANGREVGKKEVTSNAYGSFTAEFVLPTGGLNGMYTLSAGDSRTIIRVEEYKRPTFDVTFEKQEGSYRVGDVVQVKGSVNTYSGVPVQDLPVQYTVNRAVRGWRMYYYQQPTLIDSGTASLNEAGEFTFPVSLKPDEQYKPDEGFYTYTISATVTSVSGETQTSTVTISAGSRSLLLNAVLPDRINKDADIKATFSATNLNGQLVEAAGEYTLYPFTDYPKRIASATPAYSGKFVANKESEYPEWKNLPSGAYKLVLTAKDEQGRDVTSETETVLFSITDKRPAVHSTIWYYGINEQFDASTPGEFIFGTSEKDVYVLMDVFAGSKRIEKQMLHLSDTVMRFTYPYKETYGDGLQLFFCFVKNGQAYSHQVTLNKKPEDRTLQLSWGTFRDKLRPGQQEEWTLTIKSPEGIPADAELLATMYDASLDKIWKRVQPFGVGYYPAFPFIGWHHYATNNVYYNFWFDRKPLRYPHMNFDYFWSDIRLSFISDNMAMDEMVVMGYGTMKQQSLSRGVDKLEAKMAAAAPSVMEEVMATEDAGEAVALEPVEGLRTNFAETAFFYPQLRTNENGEVVIAFTMPESLTRWSFSGYAHTKEMFTGMISDEVVTSKEFMLTPNLPRFVRVGDKSAVSASVANLTENAVSGTVVLTFFNPLTEKVIATQKQKFSAEAGKTVGVNFMFTATDKYDLLGCRIVAQGGAFSDGEQHLLPVLSDKERVIETIALPIRGEQTREFSLEGLFNNNSKTATDHRLTVEFSGNPAWYAVQALPSLSVPTNDNAISWATAYYANALASHIVNSQPRIKTIFDTWKAQGGTKETFLSNLEKNQDVKSILLEESPWLMEATTEQDRMERIATLFDLNTIQNRNITALNKLKELQLANGSWTWYKGMTGSRYITNFVTQSLVRLQMLTGNTLDRDALAMQQSAFGFLHKEAQEEHKRIIEAEKRGAKFNGISDDALQYLYLIAISGERVPDKSKAAYNYFLNKVNTLLPTKDVTGKAVAAVILQKAGRTTDARAFIASLKEYTTQTDEMGMYFAFNEDPYTWKGLKVPAHVSVMEAFDVVAEDRAAVEEMKLWLLKQKQTQQWNSPIATANAVHALLYRGDSPLDNQGDVRITLGNKVMETLSPAASSTPGMAYIKETITDKATLKAKKAVVEKRDAGIAWGAIYAEYKEDISNVTAYGEGLGIEKKLYVEKVSGDKKELVPLASGAALAVGDKVVSRITITLDRSMDFVQLKDQRGACFEPIHSLSGYVWNRGVGYYVAVKDGSTNFYFDALSKGVYVLEHSYRVSRSGTYEGGLSTIQSAYAPEYAAHSASTKVIVE